MPKLFDQDAVLGQANHLSEKSPVSFELHGLGVVFEDEIGRLRSFLGSMRDSKKTSVEEVQLVDVLPVNDISVMGAEDYCDEGEVNAHRDFRDLVISGDLSRTIVNRGCVEALKRRGTLRQRTLWVLGFTSMDEIREEMLPQIEEQFNDN